MLKVGKSEPQFDDSMMSQQMAATTTQGPSEFETGEAIPSDTPQNGESVFDTNFDAGVEADEDEDPKKYIQQLTGKLSQTLSTYNNESGNQDEELNKYVANMVVKQAAKGLDDSSKKDIIKTINTTVGDSAEDDAENAAKDCDGLMGSEQAQGTPDEDAAEMAMNEMVVKKSKFNEVLECLKPIDDVKNGEKTDDPRKLKKGPFSSKQFKK